MTGSCSVGTFSEGFDVQVKVAVVWWNREAGSCRVCGLGFLEKVTLFAKFGQKSIQVQQMIIHILLFYFIYPLDKQFYLNIQL